MKNPLFLLFFFLLSSAGLFSQDDYPTDAQPGECYVRCNPEPKWEKTPVTVEKTPAYNELKTKSPEYTTVEEKIVIKPASKRFEFKQAQFKKVLDTIVVVEPFTEFTVETVQFVEDTTQVEVQPAYNSWEWKPYIENCKSTDPRACQVLCLVKNEPKTVPVPVKKLKSEPKYSSRTVGQKTMIIEKEIMVSPPEVIEREIPAVYQTIKKRVLVKDAFVEKVEVKPAYDTLITVRFEDTRSGIVKPMWVKIDCKWTEPNPLPIYYKFDKFNLTEESKKIIDERLYNLMLENPYITIQINAHTDSRDSDKYNLALSKKRAQSVVDYLIGKGISPKRLIAKGWGETRLTNKCDDGVPCTETEHQMNRRTEFQVVSN